MKSKKLLRALTIALTTSLLLTGCSMPNLFNKDSGTQEELPPQEVPTAYIQANTGLSFTVGDVVTFNDLAVVDPAVSGNVIQSVIMNADGSVADSYVLDTVGENIIITVAVQYLDGTSETAEVLLNVEEPKITFPEALKNNIDNAEWTKMSIADYAGTDESFVLSHVEDDKYLYAGPGHFSFNSEYDGTYSIVRLTPADVQSLIDAGFDYKKVDFSFKATFDMLEAMMGLFDAEDMGEDVDAEMLEQAKAVAGYNTELLTSKMSGTEISLSDTYIYDTNGNKYPVSILSYTFDGTAYGTPTVTYDGAAIVQVGTDVLLITYQPCEVMWEDAVEDTDETSADEDKYNKDLQSVKSFDEYVTLTMEAGMMESALESYYDVFNNKVSLTNPIMTFCDRVIIGDVTTLLPKEEPEVLPTPDDTSADIAPESTEEPELKDAINEKQGQYLRDHAGIFKWPENDTIYSRWDYSIDADTGFVATVTLPNGTVIKSEMGGDWRLEYDPTSGGNGGTTIFKDDEAKVQLVSSYGKYDVSNFTNISRLTVEMDKSTTSRAVITLEGSRYYIETARITNIQSYAKTSLYDTSEFKNGNYSITSSDNVLTTSEGYTITEYNITYTNSKGKEVTYPYMSVININNDYLVCYGDDIVEADETSLFTKILGETVKVSSEE